MAAGEGTAEANRALRFRSECVEREPAVKTCQRVSSNLPDLHHSCKACPRAFAQQAYFSQLGGQSLCPESKVDFAAGYPFFFAYRNSSNHNPAQMRRQPERRTGLFLYALSA